MGGGLNYDRTNETSIGGGTTMTTFEIIILTALYLFAFGYMVMAFDIDNEHNTWIDRLCILMAVLIVGIIYFPTVFAIDIWKTLNKEERQ